MTKTWIEAARTKIRDVLSAEPAAVPVRLVLFPPPQETCYDHMANAAQLLIGAEECVTRLELLGSDAADELLECLRAAQARCLKALFLLNGGI